MNQKVSISLIILVLTVTLPCAQAGEILDRIVATVNGQIILQSDWQDAIEYEAFIAQRPLDTLSSGDRKAALDHLIDQELLREQMHTSDSAQPAKQEIESQIEEIRKEYGDATSDSQWKDLLALHQLTENELRRRITLQLELSRLVDIHLRPAANVSSKSIESYYQEQLLPQLRQSGAKDVPLVEVSPKIKELLTQQKISELLVSWLLNLRAGSRIRTQLYSSSDGNVPQ